MVPCSCGESELALAEGSDWSFDWEPGLSDRTTRIICGFTYAVGLSAILLCGFLISGAIGAFGAALVLIVCLVPGIFFGYLSGRGRPVGSVRITPIGICMRNDGQAPMRVAKFALHPLCAVVSLHAHDPQQSLPARQIVFWRHHFSRQQYRRMTLVLRWLSRGAAYE